MKKRVLLIAGAILVGIVIVTVLRLGRTLLAIDVGPELTLLASVALIVVTWIYVAETRRLVSVQVEQSRDMRRSNHYRALSRIWVETRRLSDILSVSAIKVPLLLKQVATGTPGTAGKQLDHLSDQLEEVADRLTRLVVDVHGNLHSEVWTAATATMAESVALARVHRVIAEEEVEARKSTRAFDFDKVRDAWCAADADVTPRDARKRWDGMVDGDRFRSLQKENATFALKCRDEIRMRVDAA